ncbi:hypothetical protein Tco_0069824 [Tanacetum coccineum]
MCKAYGGEPPSSFLEPRSCCFFYIDNKIVPYEYPKLLLEDNKLDKKSFKDVISQHAQEDPLYHQISTYPCNVRTFLDPILCLVGLKTSWKYSPKNSSFTTVERVLIPSLFWVTLIIYANNVCFVYLVFTKMYFRSVIMEGIDGGFYFEPEGGVGDGEGISPSIKTVNNEALVINVEPLNSAPPS